MLASRTRYSVACLLGSSDARRVAHAMWWFIADHHTVRCVRLIVKARRIKLPEQDDVRGVSAIRHRQGATGPRLIFGEAHRGVCTESDALRSMSSLAVNRGPEQNADW